LIFRFQSAILSKLMLYFSEAPNRTQIMEEVLWAVTKGGQQNIIR
jgi:hypothetical protein